jgi:hypothetical protein
MSLITDSDLHLIYQSLLYHVIYQYLRFTGLTTTSTHKLICKQWSTLEDFVGACQLCRVCDVSSHLYLLIL